MNDLVSPYYSTPIFWLLFAIVAILFFIAGMWLERRRQRRLGQPLRRQLTIRRA